MNTCATCAFGTLIPKDLTKRICRGGPPQLVPLQTQQGVQIQPMFPMVNINDEACGTYKPKFTVVLDSEPKGAA